jgi:hypothetical protein
MKEYSLAVEDATFLASVRSNLDASELPNPTPQELLESKFYFGGYSCRYMFGLGTKAVAMQIQEALDQILDVSSYAQGSIGLSSPWVVNRLFGKFSGSGSVLISRFAISLIYAMKGPEAIHNLKTLLGGDITLSVDGGLFETWFFACLRSGKRMTFLDEHNAETFSWDPAPVEVENLNAIPRDHAVWWKPLKRDQGGYDAIFVDKAKKLVRLVQVTEAVKHSFDIRFFALFMERLAEEMETTTLEIYFISPVGQVIQISPVSGEGLLAAFDGWKNKGQEVSLVKRGYLPGWKKMEV